MTTLWLTYAWADNKNQDVDFLAQELGRAKLTVKLDRWNINAGSRLWEQIEKFITDPTESDAWAIYATTNSLGSEACKEEFAYALDRALKGRGKKFPVIGVFPASVDNSLIPVGIKTRLYVSMQDPDWKERIVAAAEGRSPNPARPIIAPFCVTTHALPSGSVIEFRPRAGTWPNFVLGIPLAEKDVYSSLVHGSSGQIPDACMIYIREGTFTNEDGQWAVWIGGNEATPTHSYYAGFSKLPSRLFFGPENGQQYMIEPK